MEPAKFLSIVAGAILMILAMAFQSATVAGGSYIGVLTIAAVLALAADACVAWLMSDSRIGWRIIAGIVMLPTAYIVVDSAGRLL